jgi:hypothetical protein
MTVFAVVALCTSASFAALGWANYQWPCNGAGYADNQNIDVYTQSWKDMCTPNPGPCPDLSVTIYYKRASEGSYTSAPMTYLGDAWGSNDEYTFTIPASETVAGDDEQYYFVWHDASDNTDFNPTDHCGDGTVNGAESPLTLHITPATSRDVTVHFTVDMRCLGLDLYSAGVFFAGDFQGWSQCTSGMTDVNNDGIYEGSFLFPAGSNPYHEYKHNRAGSDGCQWEGVGNRTFIIDESGPDMDLPIVKWDNWDCPLAVEFGTFAAVAGYNVITLNWNTLSEVDNARFEIERDGSLMTQVASLGNTTSGHSYSFVDHSVVNGSHYSYTLFAVDLSGSRAELATTDAVAGGAVSSEYMLSANFPNPFNPSTTIAYSLANAGLVNLKVYDLTGRVITTLVNENQESGSHTVSFDGVNLPSGIYYYRLTAGSFSATNKMVLMK